MSRLLAIPALLFALFWGTSAGAQAVELTLWHAYRGQERTTLERLLTQYDNAHPEITVVSRAIPYDGYITKLEAAIPRGNGPDLFIAAHERLSDWARMELVQPTATDPKNTAKGLHLSTLRALLVDKTIYGLPLAYKCLALFYDPSRIPNPPQTTDELLAFARQHSGPTQYGLAYSATEPYFHAPWMHGFGGGVFKDDTVSLDNSGNRESLRFAKELLDEGLIPDEPTAALVTQLFNEGSTPMVINGPWFLGEIDPGTEFAVAPLPRVTATGKHAAPYITVEAIQVSPLSAQAPDAWALARWLVAKEQALVRAMEGRQNVATLAAVEDARVSQDPVLSAFASQLEHAIPLPNRSEMGKTWEPMARAIRRVMRGAITPADALRQAQNEYSVLARPPPPKADPLPWIIIVVFTILALMKGAYDWARKHRQEIVAWRHAYTWILPATVAMAVLVIAPFTVGAAVSLLAHNNGEWTFVGWSNFLDILFARDWPLSSPLSFWFTLAVTMLWTGANVVLHVSLGMALAMVLRAPWLRMRGVYRVLLILPWAIPNYITALIWKGMFHRQFGAINGVLGWLGVEPVSWFSQFSTAFTANLVTNTWLGFPFMMVVTLGALQAIPQDLEEAAAIDGANRWQRFRHVVWPLLRPALLPAVILGSIWTFNMFNIIYLVSAGEPDGSTEILISEAYRWAFTRGHRYGYAAAYAVLIFGVLVVYGRITDRILARKTT